VNNQGDQLGKPSTVAENKRKKRESAYGHTFQIWQTWIGDATELYVYVPNIYALMTSILRVRI